MAIIDIRGTHGSGKSTLMRMIMENFTARPITEGPIHLGYHLTEPNAAVLGKYTNACGGCDGIKNAREIERRIRLFKTNHNHILLEGILVAHTFQRYSYLAAELGDYIFVFLDTPLSVCLARVHERRRLRGDNRPFNPNNLIRDYTTIFTRVRKKCIAAGHRTLTVSYQDPLPPVLRLMGD